MGINNNEFNQYSQPRLEDEPFYENPNHCEEDVDRALLMLDVNEFMDIKPELLKKAKNDLEYAKELLQPSTEFPDQEDVDTRFLPLVGEIMENEENWGVLGEIYAKVSNFVSMERTIDY